MQKKADDETYDYLYQKIPNSISSKELYCEKDLGVNINYKLIQYKFYKKSLNNK